MKIKAFILLFNCFRNDIGTLQKNLKVSYSAKFDLIGSTLNSLFLVFIYYVYILYVCGNMYIHIFMHPNPSFIIKLIRIRPQQRSFPEMVAGLAFQVYGLMKGKDMTEMVYSDFYNRSSAILK